MNIMITLLLLTNVPVSTASACMQFFIVIGLLILA